MANASSFCVVMLGASGAVGGIAAQALRQLPQVKQLTLLNRRQIPAVDSARVTQYTVDVLDPQSYTQLLPGHDSAVCCLGVGQPSKVSKEEFVKVDKTAVLDFAKACRNAGVRHFQLLSAVGADAQSSSHYLRTKGDLQDAIIALGFERVSFFQPSMILTPSNRYGFSQALLLLLWPGVSTLMVGSLKKYRGIAVDTLGRAMAKNAITTGQGVEILQWSQINA
jgi:uncharacterized protein YbjT (DUF2867 family)